uniref:Uncharacterized protein n=1 Tax=Helianthus annuus TaxID=4232 RepID=A0A251UTD7_HELAN
MIAKVESCMPTRSLMRMNWRIHQRLKRSLVLFHMVHPLILMLVCNSTFLHNSRYT